MWFKKKQKEVPQEPIVASPSDIAWICDYFDRTGLRTLSTCEAIGVLAALSLLPRVVDADEWISTILGVEDAEPADLDVFQHEAVMLALLHNHVFEVAGRNFLELLERVKDADSLRSFCSGFVTGLQMDPKSMLLVEGEEAFKLILILSGDRVTEEEQKRYCDARGIDEEELYEVGLKRLPGALEEVIAFLTK